MSEKQIDINVIENRIRHLISVMIKHTDEAIRAYTKQLETVQEVEKLIKPIFTRSLIKTHPDLCELVEDFYKAGLEFFTTMQDGFVISENSITAFLEQIESYKRGLNG